VRDLYTQDKAVKCSLGRDMYRVQQSISFIFVLETYHSKSWKTAKCKYWIAVL